MENLANIRTLQEAIVYFSDEMNCIKYVCKMRWPDGVVVCPNCGRTDVSWLEKQRKFQCKSRHSRRQFSVKVGTIFEDSPIDLSKWLMAAWMIVNCRNGISSYEISRDIGITQKSAWFMMHRLRLAMKDEYTEKMGGEGGTVEADETFVGGKPKNRHVGKREGADKKVPVMGMYDRGTRQVRAAVIPNVRMEHTHGAVVKNVKRMTNVFTDGWTGYQNLSYAGFMHETVNHVNEYVRGQVHTNGIENFWSLFKRNLAGTYVAVEPFHLHRYLDEQTFRFNTCKSHNDDSRFRKVLSQVAGRRLTLAQVTGKVGGTRF
ncbi:MAG TPA: IS1595 family transposase [Acidobacteriaceae bacterium]|jgi:transposase-like protein